MHAANGAGEEEQAESSPAPDAPSSAATAVSLESPTKRIKLEGEEGAAVAMELGGAVAGPAGETVEVMVAVGAAETVLVEGGTQEEEVEEAEEEDEEEEASGLLKVEDEEEDELLKGRGGQRNA